MNSAQLHFALSALMLLGIGLHPSARAEVSARRSGETGQPTAQSAPALGGVKVFNDSMFQTVGGEVAGEYSSAQYDAWVAACEGKKAESMQAFRDCFAEQKKKALGRTASSVRDTRERSKRKDEYRNVPPRSSLENEIRNPQIDATTDVTVEPEGEQNDSEND